MRGAALVLLACAGCATILANGTQRISIEANPGAKILIDGQQVGVSPGIVDVPAHQDHDVTVGDKTCHLSASLGAGWFIADFFLTAFIGIIVDAVTGDWNSIDVTECRI